MHVRDWKLFVEGEWLKEIAVAQVASELADLLGATTRNVYLQQAYARKAIEKHGLTFGHLPLIFETVDYGIALSEPGRPLHLTFLHYVAGPDDKPDWYQVSIKRGQEDRRLFLATFHRSSRDEVARKGRKYTTVRPGRR